MKVKVTLFDFIWRHLRPQAWRFSLITFLSLIWAIDATFWPYLFGKITDTLTQHDTSRQTVWSPLRPLLIAAFIFWIGVESCFRWRGFLQAKAYPKLEADIRMAMFDHVQRHSPKYFNEHFAGTLSNRINDMTSEVTQLLISAVHLFSQGL